MPRTAFTICSAFALLAAVETVPVKTACASYTLSIRSCALLLFLLRGLLLLLPLAALSLLPGLLRGLLRLLLFLLFLLLLFLFVLLVLLLLMCVGRCIHSQ